MSRAPRRQRRHLGCLLGLVVPLLVTGVLGALTADSLSAGHPGLIRGVATALVVAAGMLLAADRRSSAVSATLGLAAGAFLLWQGRSAPGPWLRSFWLALGVLFVVRAALKLVAFTRLDLLLILERRGGSMAGAAAITAVGLSLALLVPPGTSRVWGQVLLVAAAVVWVKFFAILWVDYSAIRTVAGCYRDDAPLPLWPAVIYVLEPPWGNVEGDWQEFLRQVGEALYARWPAVRFALPDGDSVSPSEWFRYLHRAFGQGFSGMVRRLHGSGAVFVSERWAMDSGGPRLHQWLLREASAVATHRYEEWSQEGVEQFEADARAQAPGLLYAVRLHLAGDDASLSAGEANARPSDAFVSEIHAQMGGTIEGSQWAELLASSNQAVRESDLRLPRPDVLVGRELIRGGLTPLALCYLRVRCAKSDVERLLGLFDCYELLVKVSVSVLLAERWGSEPAEVARGRAEFLRRPSLGQWVFALRSLVDTPRGGKDGIGDVIVNYWREPFRRDTGPLIDAVKGSGMFLKAEIPRSHLGWLEWLNNLRNATKGHGVLDDRKAAPLWHRFHEAFLGSVAGLRALTIEAPLSVHSQADVLVEIRGCAEFRLGGGFVSPTGTQDVPAEVTLRTPSPTGSVAVSPILLWAGQRFWTWNGVQGKGIDYLDYGWGDIRRFRFADSDAFTLWSGGVGPVHPDENPAKQA